MFSIAQSDDLSPELRDKFPVPEIVAVSAHANHSALHLMAKILEHDIMWQAQSFRMGSETQRQFLLLCHAEELELVEHSFIQSLRRFVTLGDVKRGIPPTHNFNLYVTDIEALGFTRDLLDDATILSSNLRFARKIVYLLE